MKKEKIINIAYYLVLVITVVIFIWGLIKVELMRCVVCCFIFLVLGLPLEMMRRKIKEEKDPLSYKRICNALSFCSKDRHGSKAEFISRHSEELYNYFIMKGIIHEPLDKNHQWELTKLGLRIYVSLKS